MEHVEGHFFCSLCNTEFYFKSKYERHLLSNKHKQFASVMDEPEAVMDGLTDGSIHVNLDANLDAEDACSYHSDESEASVRKIIKNI